MESDSSLENEETQQNRRDWSKVPPTQNSDVSDDENFSRGAKSIESPPESPLGGANLDSPPASPAPRRSPGSVSGSERTRSPERPQTPDSGPESPQNSSSPHNSRNSAPSSPNSQSSKNDRSRKSRSSSSEGRSPSPTSHNERAYSVPEEKRSTSPQSDKGPQSPVSDRPNSPVEVRSPSFDKEGPQSPSSDNNHSPHSIKSPSQPKYGKQMDSSDSDASPVRNSFHSDSDEDDRSSDDYRRRRKSKRSSSASSGGSSRRQSEKPQQEKDLDLSDVSDCDSLGAVSDEEKPMKDKKEKEDGEKGDLTMIDDSEQLDFEAEEAENKVENGQINPPPQKTPQNNDIIEIKDDEELEEGELSDEGDARPEETEPRPVCRFFNRGQCTWGSSCSYRHIGEGGGQPAVAPSTQSGTPPSSKPSVQHPAPSQHSAPIVQHGPPMMHHGAPMHHPPRFVPRPHGPPFFRRPLRPVFPRFVHPGVTDKGNYTMFEMVRPLVPMNAGGPMLHGGPHGPPHHPPHHHMYPPHMDPYMRPPHIERPPPPMVRTQMPPPFQHQPAVTRKDPDPSSESAWERGLRQAKELIRKSSKRKETDADFEEKKMTMSLSGGAEGVDKENEFYSQAPHSAPGGTTSPYEEDHYSRYNKIDDRRLSREGYRERGYDYGGGGGGGGGGGAWPYDDEESPPPPVHHRGSHRYPSRHHHQGRDHQRGVDYEYFDDREDRERDRERERDRDRRRDGKDGARRKSRSYREKQSPRDSSHADKQPLPYDISPSEVPEKRRYERNRGGNKTSKRGADDEWADPWMRSKSPARKSRAPRKQSYSSKSSFSSSSSSRSSSYSSYSRSESRSSASGSSRSRSRSTSALRRDKKRKTSTNRRNKSPFSRGSDKRSSDVERSLHMNPPAPSPTAPNVYSRLSPSQRRDRKELSARLIAAAMRKHKRSSTKSSSSGSDSSNSSEDSSSSLSDSHSSSSSRTPSPAPPPSASHKSSRKKVVMDEKMAQTMKVKAMDALKLSGQKQQIKLNLKGKDSLSERLQQQPVSSSRKRAADSLPFDDASPPNMKMKKSGPSRREELLKQLKAVEDAIARKRSKI